MTAREVVVAAVAPFALSLLLGVASYAAAGPSLGVYFAGVLLATIVTPPVVLAHERLARRALAGAGIVDGLALVWLVAGFRSDTSLGAWSVCYLLLAAWVLAVAGLALLLQRRRPVAPVAASAIAVVTGLAWLTWPVWLSPWLSGNGGAAVVAWLAPAHPLLAINAVLLHLGAWSEQQLAYHLTNLGQDVPYRLPATAFPAIAVHALLGTAFVFVTTRRSDESTEVPTDPAGSLQ